MNILSKDSLRDHVEKRTDGHVTILYDSRGIPSYMMVIPRMTIGQVLGVSSASEFRNHPLFRDYINIPSGSTNDAKIDSFLNQTHPAFWVYKSVPTGDGDYFLGYASEVFVGLFLSSVDSPHSLPNSILSVLGKETEESFGDVYSAVSSLNISENIFNQTLNFRLFNVWEYSLLKMFSQKSSVPICGFDDEMNYSLLVHSSDDAGRIVSDKYVDMILEYVKYRMEQFPFEDSEISLETDLISFQPNSVPVFVYDPRTNATSQVKSYEYFNRNDATFTRIYLYNVRGKFNMLDPIKIVDNNGGVFDATVLGGFRLYGKSAGCGHIDWCFNYRLDGKILGIRDLVSSLAESATFIDGAFIRKVKYYGSDSSYCLMPVLYKGGLDFVVGRYNNEDFSLSNEMFFGIRESDGSNFPRSRIFRFIEGKLYSSGNKLIFKRQNYLNQYNIFASPTPSSYDLLLENDYYNRMSNVELDTDNLSIIDRIYLSLSGLAVNVDDVGLVPSSYFNGTSSRPTYFMAGKLDSSNKISYYCHCVNDFLGIKPYISAWNVSFRARGYKRLFFRLSYPGKIIEGSQAPDPLLYPE